MWTTELKVAGIAFLMLAVVVYSSSVEKYQNYSSYYPGYGDPIYSGVTGDSAPYVNQTQQQPQQPQQQGGYNQQQQQPQQQYQQSPQQQQPLQQYQQSPQQQGYGYDQQQDGYSQQQEYYQ
jgi:hypothetical protein